MADDFNPDDFSPATRPAFIDPARASSIGYVGVGPDEVPKFDDELLEFPEVRSTEGRPPTPETADVVEGPSRGIITRYREIARLHAFGKTNNEICALLGYTASRMSIILLDPFVQSEIRMWRDRLLDDDAIGILKGAARDGARRLHRIILDPAAKDALALDASKFAIEKTHGKARQEVTVESGTLTMFMETLREMRERGEPLDVTPRLEAPRPSDTSAESVAQAQGHNAERNQYDTWLDANLT